MADTSSPALRYENASTAHAEYGRDRDERRRSWTPELLELPG